MRIVHASDIHLDFRAFARLTPSGRNQRSQDVSDAWFAFVTCAIELQPDLILIGGDLFHRWRPSPAALDDAVVGFMRLMKALPGVPILQVCGNHDEPKQAGEGCALQLLARLGVLVVMDARRIALPDLNAHVLCVADSHIARVALEPGPQPGIHLLLAHGSIGGRLAKLPGVDVLPPDVLSDRFAYIALGDYHCTEQVARNAWYSGAIEFTSSDPWREIGMPHGFLLVDTDAGTVEHQAVPTRRFIDLPQVSAHDATVADVTAKILANVSAQDIAGAVVRQVVTDCLRSTRKAIDPRVIRKAVAGALHFQLDVREPEEIRIGRPTDPDRDWIDDLNAEDEAAPVFDGVTDVQVNAWLADPASLAAMAAANLDPYGLDAILLPVSKRKTAA